MLENAPLWVTIPVKSLDRAKRFYEEVLGFTHEQSMDGDVELFQAGRGTKFILYRAREHISEWGKNTTGVFITDNLDQVVEELKEKGVRFDSLAFPDLKSDDNYIVHQPGGTRSVWFKDSEGNSLCLTELGTDE